MADLKIQPQRQLIRLHLFCGRRSAGNLPAVGGEAGALIGAGQGAGGGRFRGDGCRIASADFWTPINLIEGQIPPHTLGRSDQRTRAGGREFLFPYFVMGHIGRRLTKDVC